MLAVGCGRDEVAPFLAEGAGIGCENSPQSVTLTGDKIRLQNTLDRLLAEKPDTLHKHLPVDVAYHSGMAESS
jgi:acyl transferase domain-containing protein